MACSRCTRKTLAVFLKDFAGLNIRQAFKSRRNARQFGTKSAVAHPRSNGHLESSSWTKENLARFERKIRPKRADSVKSSPQESSQLVDSHPSSPASTSQSSLVRRRRQRPGAVQSTSHLRRAPAEEALNPASKPLDSPQPTSAGTQFASLRPRRPRLNPREPTTTPNQPPIEQPAWAVQKAALAAKLDSQPWNPRRKLSPDALAGIRALHAAHPTTFTTPVLAARFAVSPEAVRRILKSKWAPSEAEAAAQRARWDRRGARIWSGLVEKGLRPPKRWRDMGIGAGFKGPKREGGDGERLEMGDTRLRSVAERIM